MSNFAHLTERTLPVAVLGLAVLGAPFLVMGESGLPRLRALREEKARVDLQVSRLAEDIRRLRAGVRASRDDPAAIERVARDQLGLVRKTELVFHFDE